MNNKRNIILGCMIYCCSSIQWGFILIHVLEETGNFQYNAKSQSEINQGNATAVLCGWFVEAGHGGSGAKNKLFFNERALYLTNLVFK